MTDEQKEAWVDEVTGSLAFSARECLSSHRVYFPAPGALEDEVRVLEDEGIDLKVTPFTRQEILPKLEHRFLHEL